MLHVILYQPEIPPNTGNIIRLCANTGFRLHLIRPLGFQLDDKRLRRAGLDYHEFANLGSYASLDDCLEQNQFHQLYAFTTKAKTNFSRAPYQANDALLFGPETRGLPMEILDSLTAEQKLRLPMLPDSRSLNLSNTVAIAVYEAWRHLDFAAGQ